MTLTVGTQTPEHYRSPRIGNTVAFLGDSITDIGLGANYFLADNWATYATALSGGRLQTIGHYGIPGQRTAQIAARVGQALQKRPALLVVLAGTNDMGDVSYGTATFTQAVAQITENLRAIYHAALDAGTVPVACTIPPVKGNGFTTAQFVQRRALVNIVNEWITTTAQQLGLPLVDFYGVLVDSGIGNSGNAGSWANIATTSSDGVHPTNEGSMIMAQTLWAVLSPLLPATAPAWLRDVGDTNIKQYNPTVPHPSLIDNPLWLNNTGQPGVRPDQATLTTSGTITYTTTLGTDPTAAFAGNVLDISITAGTAGSAAGLQYAALPSGISNVNAGDLIRFRGRFRKDIGVGVQVQAWVGSQPNRYTPILITSAATAITGGAWDFLFRAPTSGGFTCNLFGRYQTAAGHVVFGQVSATNLTQCGLDTREMSRLIPEHPNLPWP